MSRLVFPQWRNEVEATKFPFADYVSLGNGAQTLLEGTLLDAVLYPAGGQAGLFLSRVTVDHQNVTLYVGDDGDPQRCSGSFSVVTPPTAVKLADAYGRPAGLFVSEPARLALFGGWGVGSFDFTRPQTEFAAVVCVPTPAAGVTGFLLPDGTLLGGEVWFVGADGVVLTPTTVAGVGPCGADPPVFQSVRVDVVGDPLFLRRLCGPRALFSTPRFVRTITFKDRYQTLVCGPDAHGDVKMTVNNDAARDTVLRVHNTGAANVVEVVGSLVSAARPPGVG